jgi:hypothetical protein
MHAWIGFFFSCTMIIVAAAGKSGYQIIPAGIGGTPNTEFMFFVGCAGFAAALAMLAPSHSTARLASIWSAGALAAVTVALNMTSFSGARRHARTGSHRGGHRAEKTRRRSQPSTWSSSGPCLIAILCRSRISTTAFARWNAKCRRNRQTPKPTRRTYRRAERKPASLRNKRSAALCARPSTC